MKTENIILVITPDGKFQAWATMSDFCKAYSLNRNSLYQAIQRKKTEKTAFPIDWNGFNIQKLPVRRCK